jgi:hypothetical protein
MHPHVVLGANPSRAARRLPPVGCAEGALRERIPAHGKSSREQSTLGLDVLAAIYGRPPGRVAGSRRRHANNAACAAIAWLFSMLLVMVIGRHLPRCDPCTTHADQRVRPHTVSHQAGRFIGRLVGYSAAYSPTSSRRELAILHFRRPPCACSPARAARVTDTRESQPSDPPTSASKLRAAEPNRAMAVHWSAADY